MTSLTGADLNNPRATSIDSLTIAITRHDESDAQLLGALHSLAGQRKVRAAVLVIGQRHSPTVADYCADSPRGEICFHYSTLPACGISRARNRAIALCQTGLLLFTEPDVRPDAYWAHYLSETLASGAAVAGGRILPDWQCRPPLVARCGLIMDLYSLLDLGPGQRETSKVVGCNFGINTTVLGSGLARFDENFGRTPGTLMGGEEMELCQRVGRAGMGIVYDGRALVIHRIDKARASYRWLIRRIHAAGASRAMKGGKPQPTNSPGVHWSTALALPLYVFYVAGYIAHKYHPRQVVAGNPE